MPSNFIDTKCWIKYTPAHNDKMSSLLHTYTITYNSSYWYSVILLSDHIFQAYSKISILLFWPIKSIILCSAYFRKNNDFFYLFFYINTCSSPLHYFLGPSWSWSYGSWIYNYLCNQCLSTLMLWVRISIRARCTT
jgi:hypothetical protein